MIKYSSNKIEKKWQKYWETKKFYVAPDRTKGKDPTSLKLRRANNFYFLVEFPYPSGNLHIGHWYTFSVSDIAARYWRMRGKNVMYPIGFDAFGLPAENAAIKNNLRPEDWTKKNIAHMTKQLKSMGAVFDWSRVVSTIDPDYYKWTQWIFLQFYKKGLAYRAKTLVNWCPKDRTVLANEQVIDGKCDRCSTEVVQKELTQWMYKITDYADRLLDDLEKMDWPEVTKTAQRNWIGRSRGAEIDFLLPNSTETIKVFTTRADTLFGATYLVLAPEHPLVTKLTKDQYLNSVGKYLEKVKKKSELERLGLEKDPPSHEATEGQRKTGIFTGAYAVNPVNNEKIPIWIADYVLGHYGTGAVMAVPAHDERDFEFAKKYKLPLRRVVTKNKGVARSYLMGAAKISEQNLRDLGIKIVEITKDGDRKIEIPEERLEEYESLVNTKLTPGFWNEYVGEKIVFIFKHKDSDIERLVLNKENEEKINTLAKQFAEQNFVSPGLMLAENSWYADVLVHKEDGVLIDSEEFNGFKSEDAREKIVEKLAAKKLARAKVNFKLHDWVLSRQRYWGTPIPMINCHKCGHQPVSEKELPIKLPRLEDYLPSTDGRSPLAKAEKWLRVKCPDCGGEAERETDTMDTFVDSSWYFLRYTDPKNKKEFASQEKMKEWLPADLYIGGAEHNTMHLLYSRFFTKALYDLGFLDFDEAFTVRRNRGDILGPDGFKMSKSRGNVIDPDDLVEKYGADTVRMYLAFMGPYEHGGPWNPGGILGVQRFLNRVWTMFNNAKEEKQVLETNSILHKTIKKIGEDIENLRFNTGVSELMKLLNELENYKLPVSAQKTFLQLLAPFAPHIAEELWMGVLKNKTSIHLEKWPEYDPKLIKDEIVKLIVQINGKMRDVVEVPTDIDESGAREAAMASPQIKKYLAGQEIKKIVYVANRLLNIVC